VPLSSPICSVQNKWRKESGGQLEPTARSKNAKQEIRLVEIL
jgi:hypothetical protein